METRREFIRKAALLAGSTGLSYALPASIRTAMAIDPAAGSTYLDAEHVVFLMQENRSFDHCFGTLQGVRGFNDPRAITLPDNNLAWLQTNAAGETYAPFRLDIKNTSATWMSSLPHSWTNQVDARNGGRYDKWLDEKRSGHKPYSNMPLTMGYYTREDIPFYYALADAFTICDQHFCSALTGTTPNRLYFWSGTIRSAQHENAKANVWNEDADYDTLVNWKTYPERLEENGIPWKIYQNDLSVPGGFTDEQDAWMANFGDNPLEYFEQYNVKLSARYISYLQQQLAALPPAISGLEHRLADGSGKELEEMKAKLSQQKRLLEKIREEAVIYTAEKYKALSPQEKNLHEKAFSSNSKDPNFYQLTQLNYQHENKLHEVTIPKGDVLHQFREDVAGNRLPTVSWLVAPENFSDHPSSAWYGAWYISEVLDILTKNPEVWKKTIFVLTYDENDGYYDHIPPFVAPDPAQPQTGKTSAGIDARSEYVSMEQERRRTGFAERHMRESAIGLGYRVPMVIASPWSRGGWVNSQVFDHTSSLQFLEKFLAHKTGKKIIETNISSWRRAICGDLRSVFRPSGNTKTATPAFIARDTFIESIHQAKFRQLPSAFKQLTQAEINQVNQSPNASSLMAQQERGTRPSCALPYELYADALAKPGAATVQLILKAGNGQFGKEAAGSPFTVYAPGSYAGEKCSNRSYAVAAGEAVSDEWNTAGFDNGLYHLRVYGPNGFFREFGGGPGSPALDVSCSYRKGNVVVKLINRSTETPCTIRLTGNAYKTAEQTRSLGMQVANNHGVIIVDTQQSGGWYDFSLNTSGDLHYIRRYAGRIETGEAGISDPAMGFPNLLSQASANMI